MMSRTTAVRLLVGLLVLAALGAFVADEPRLGFGIVILAALFGAIALGGWWLRDRPRGDAHRYEARRLRLRYAARDPHDLASLPHPLLHRPAASRDIEHVAWGSWMGIPVHVFEYSYSVGRQQGDGGSGAERFTCVLTPVPASWPALTIEPRRTLTAVAESVTTTDLRTESDAFNRAFHVRGPDAAFGSALLDARMIACIEDDASSFGFHLVDGNLLAFTPQVDPWRIEWVLGMTGGFLAHVPVAVGSLYPVEGGSARTRW